MSKIGESVDLDNRWLKAEEVRGRWEVTANGHKVSLEDDKIDCQENCATL